MRGLLPCIVLFCCVAVSARGAEMISLKLKPAKGDVFKLKATIEQKVTQTFEAGPQTLNQTIVIAYSFIAQDIAADGAATMKVTYDTVTFKQQSNLGNIEFDSANPPQQIHPLAKGLAALAGQSFTMKITSTGKITAVQGVDAMLDSIIKKLDIPEGPSRPAIEKKLRSEFGEDALRENMEILLAIYPDKPVAIGESWSRKLAITRGFPLSFDNGFALKEAAPDAVTLEVTSRLSTNPDAQPIDLGGRKLSYTFAGEQTGTMKLARPTGWVKSADLTQKITGEAITDAGAGRMTKTPMTIETRMILEGKPQ